MVRVLKSEQVRIEARGLPAASLGVLGLVVAELLDPLLSLDQSPAGRDRSEACRGLWRSAVDDAGNLAASCAVRNLIAQDSELHQRKEPAGPAAYRVDYLAALLYAVRSFTENSVDDLIWCIQRVTDSLGFLADEISRDPLPAFDDHITAIIRDLRLARSVDKDAVMRLRAHLESPRQGLQGLVTRPN